MTKEEFETYWQEHRSDILNNNAEWLRAKREFKISSGSDLILYGIPVVVGIVFMNNVKLANELLSWAAGAAVTIACFAICVWLKSIITDTESPDVVEDRIKRMLCEEMTGDKHKN